MLTDLFKSHGRDIWLYFRSLGFSGDHCDDLVQDTFLSAFRHLGERGTTDPSKAWLLEIAQKQTRRRISGRPGLGVVRNSRNLNQIPLGEWQRIESALVRLYERPPAQEVERHLKHDLLVVDGELIKYLQRNPELMYRLDPRNFEILVAELLKDLGYVVELTSHGADGGVDIFATQSTPVGEALIVIDCKRYLPTKRIGVGVVRALYGVAEEHRASMALLATTSYFTQPALEFQARVRYRLSLRDYDDLRRWLEGFPTGSDRRGTGQPVAAPDANRAMHGRRR